MSLPKMRDKGKGAMHSSLLFRQLKKVFQWGFLLLSLLCFSLSTYAADVPILSGDTMTGNIALAGQSFSYTFSANSGDTATILMGVSSGSLYPKVELHAPDGAVVKTTYSTGGSATIEAQILSQTGTYSILCRDYNGLYTGNYAVSLIKNPGAINTSIDPDGGAIQSGDTRTGTISVGDLDAYTFSANSGDTATILMGVSSGSLYPKVELHAPDGTVVKTAYNTGGSATIEAQKLNQTGTYFILCRDYNGFYTGNYAVSLIKNPGAINTSIDPDGGAIQSGDTRTGTISVGDLDVYTFSANSGDTATILMGVSSGSLYPKVELHAPDGTVVRIAYSTTGESATIEAQKLNQTGTYFILCRDYNGFYTGNYAVSLIKNPGAINTSIDPDGGAIQSGDTRTGTISVGDLDGYTFSASNGDTASLLLSKSSGIFFPQVELHAPDGTVVKTTWGVTSATIEAQKLNQTGTYFILCRDSYGYRTGDYSLSLTLVRRPISSRLPWLMLLLDR
jgi:trimeric autotransporter adhesin